MEQVPKGRQAREEGDTAEPCRMVRAKQGEQSYLRMKREDTSPCLLHAGSSSSSVHTLSKAVPSGAQAALQCMSVGAQVAGVAVRGCPVWTRS